MSEFATGRQEVGWGPFESEDSLPARFARVAQVHGGRIALASDGWQPSYRELNDTANRLALELLHRGGARGDRVAILMRHDTPLIASMLAVLKAGRICVVLNTTDPADRLMQLMRDAEPAAMLADVANQDLAVGIAGDNSTVLRYEDCAQDRPTQDPGLRISPDEIAFLVYTSGSMGRPHGVMRTHRQEIRNAVVHSRLWNLNTDDRIVLLPSLSGGLGVTISWCALLHGASLFPFSLQERNIVSLARELTDRRVTVFASATSFFRNFMKSLNQDVGFADVRVVRIDTEAVTSDDFKAFQRHFPERCMFVHTLGSSEAGNIAQLRLRRDDTVSDGRLPVGRILNDIEVRLLDEDGRDVHSGEPGEIVVRSQFLANGYWREPALTAKRFSADPAASGMRIFRTGDLGRINSEGLLEILGRKEDFVKIHGYRVELSEVEAALNRLPVVASAAVLAVERQSDTQLIAYVVPHGGQSLTSVQIGQSLREFLPGYMVPATIVILETLPLTPHGKIDREKVRLIPLEQHLQSAAPPITRTEAVLAEIWAEALVLARVDRHDNFFDLGGDSLRATIVAAKAHAVLQIELHLGMFTDHPTLAELASFIDDTRRTGVAEDTPGLVRVPRDKPLPLSFFQERIWTFCRPTKRSNYNSPRCYRILGPLDCKLLHECMSYIAQRHESLRTSFATVDGQPVQIVHSTAAVLLRYVDFADSQDSEDKAIKLCGVEASSTFDLSQAPLYRFLLVRIRENEHWLLRVFHHIICDVWSMQMYFRELALLYEAKLRGENPPLPELAQLQYGDYAVWHRHVMRPGRPMYQRAISWWQNMLSDAPPALSLPRKRGEAATRPDCSEARIYWGVDPLASQQLRELGHIERATFYVVRLAAFVALLSAESAQSDVVLGTYMSLRNRAELQDIFGPFHNLVTLRFQFESRRTFREWLLIVRDQILATEAYSELPYEQLRKEMRDRKVTLPEIRIIFGVTDLQPLEIADLKLSNVELPLHTMPWGLSANFNEYDEEHNCILQFDATIYEPAYVQEFAGRLRQLASDIARHPDLPMEELSAMRSLVRVRAN